MFTRPKNGWTEIHLEDFEGLGSYIQDIPVMVLDRGVQSVQSVQERTPLKLWFDEEESAFTLTADEETKIVTEGEFGAEEYNIKCSKLDLIREIKNDIEKYFSDWVTFSEDYAYAEEEAEAQEIYQKREKMLKKKLTALEAALQKYTK